MTQPTDREPPLARLVGRRPNRGAADAAKVVVADVQQLLRAEIDLAKAEVANGVKSKVMGLGFFIGAAIVGWLAVQAFLVWLGFLFGTFLPAWAASGLVLLLLLIVIGVLGFLGYRKLQAETSLRITKATVEESKAATNAAIEQAKANTREGVEEAKATLAQAAAELRARAEELRGRKADELAAQVEDVREAVDQVREGVAALPDPPKSADHRRMETPR